MRWSLLHAPLKSEYPHLGTILQILLSATLVQIYDKFTIIQSNGKISVALTIIVRNLLLIMSFSIKRGPAHSEGIGSLYIGYVIEQITWVISHPGTWWWFFRRRVSWWLRIRGRSRGRGSWGKPNFLTRHWPPSSGPRILCCSPPFHTHWPEWTNMR